MGYVSTRMDEHLSGTDCLSVGFAAHVRRPIPLLVLLFLQHACIREKPLVFASFQQLISYLDQSSANRMCYNEMG